MRVGNLAAKPFCIDGIALCWFQVGNMAGPKLIETEHCQFSHIFRGHRRQCDGAMDFRTGLEPENCLAYAVVAPFSTLLQAKNHFVIEDFGQKFVVAIAAAMLVANNEGVCFIRIPD